MKFKCQFKNVFSIILKDYFSFCIPKLKNNPHIPNQFFSSKLQKSPRKKRRHCYNYYSYNVNKK